MNVLKIRLLSSENSINSPKIYYCYCLLLLLLLVVVVVVIVVVVVVVQQQQQVTPLSSDLCVLSQIMLMWSDCSYSLTVLFVDMCS
jgi:hypothetical protein